MLTVLGSACPRLSLGKGSVLAQTPCLRGPQRRAQGTQTPEAGVGTVRPLLDQLLPAAPLGTRLGPFHGCLGEPGNHVQWEKIPPRGPHSPRRAGRVPVW